MDSTPDFHAYKGGIFNDTTNSNKLTHFVSLVGYGVENGIDYWIGKNSWGTYWGENGFFKLVKGTNNLGIENEYSYPIPDQT